MTSCNSIHPAAYVDGNSIIIPSIKRSTYERILSLLPLFPHNPRLRLEYIKSTKHRSYLSIAMINDLHELLAEFGAQIKDQIWDAGFLPRPLGRDTIETTGSKGMHLAWGDTSRDVLPDAGIAMFHRDNTFLVLEVAVSQTEKSAMEKAQDYILGSRGKVTFVILVMVERKPASITRPTPGVESAQESSESAIGQLESNDRTAYNKQSPKDSTQVSNWSTSSTTSTFTASPSDLSSWSVARHFLNQNSAEESLQSDEGSGPDQSQPLLESLSKSDALGPEDHIFVSVYKSVKVPPPIGRTGLCVIDRVEVYPHSTDASFSIAWSNVTSTPWPDAISKYSLANNNPEPKCEIGFSSLHSLAREAAGLHEVEDDGIKEDTTSPGSVRKFVQSSSPQMDLSSDSTLPSDEEQRLDPDYQFSSSTDGPSRGRERGSGRD